MNFQNALPALGLLLIMVLVAVALQRWRRHLPSLARHQGPPMQVLGSLALGPQQRVVALQVGEGEQRQCLLLGVTPSQISALQTLPCAPETGLPDTDAPAAGDGFAPLLARFRKPADDNH
ncbi:FliO/MopB family protein [Hydrogenophaga sp. NFH-34]|uniref:FliO/MopB family protein n=1 Tax=Hydrogenophaga sp. NFH-34 TaxID=2744446 RepID=UPI001F31C0C2|nr:flagellar biosynthetic protein FliO [Hydrogenophaga sp. NFH-34]